VFSRAAERIHRRSAIIGSDPYLSTPFGLHGSSKQTLQQTQLI
jgi:hypothetical protein